MTQTQPSFERKMWIFPIALACLEIATYLGLDAYLPALPSIMHDLSLSKASVQTTLTVWFLGSASLQLLIGPLSDYYGRKPIVLWGGVAFLLASLACALTESLPILLIARFIQGMAVCTTIVAGQASIHEYYDSKRAIEITAIMGSITILAPAVGPLFGALIIQFSHWRNIFFILFLWGLITSAVLYIHMKETLKSPITLHLDRSLKAYWKIITHTPYMRYCLISCCLFFGLEAWILSSPFLLMHSYHLSELQFGLSQMAIFSSYILGMQYCRARIKTASLKHFMKHTLILTLLGSMLLLLISMLMTLPPAWLVIALMTLIAFGAAATSTPLTRLAMDTSSASMGQKMAIYSFCFSLTGVCGATLLTLISMATPLPMALLELVGFSGAAILFKYSYSTLKLNSTDLPIG